MPGRLFLCATPIGNLGDVTPRLRETLSGADVIYAEDTRRTGRLLSALGVTAKMRSFFTGNERRRTRELERDLRSGRDVAVVTDAGTPSVSDPGSAAVTAARKVGSEVIVIPGPSAVTAAVAGSGMVESRFAFEGFLPRSGKDRARRLGSVASEPRPVVLFLSPHRARQDLDDLADACGPDREICVARELTKVHEELWWGTLGSARERWSEEAPRGEITIVMAAAPTGEVPLDEARALARQMVEEGMSPSVAAREAAAATGVARRAIYEGLIR
ncbi:MAG: 16S rRNA (cytidine(1402)-2'-O)-methyltransferase [Actinomycetota bacterium]